MKLIRITTVPISLDKLITGQMKFMKSKGIDVTMISADGPEVSQVIEREGCPHIVVPLTRQITPFADLAAIWKMYRVIRSIKPDIVHTHTPKAGIVGMIASWMAGVRHRIHTVAGLPLEVNEGLKRSILVFAEKLTYAFATNVWPNSMSLQQYILENKFTYSNKLKVIGQGSSNGIDLMEFDPSNIDISILKRIKSEINYSTENKYLLFVGRVVKDKGIEELVKSFERLCSSHINLRLIIVGPYEEQLDPLSEDTKRAIEENKNIITVGFSNFVKYYMHLADLFVFPSHREGFPNVLLQAGLMNLPIVCSRINGNVDIVEHNVTGLLFEKGSVVDLIDKILYALNHNCSLKEFTKRNRLQILEKYDRNVVHNILLSEYLKLINE